MLCRRKIRFFRRSPGRSYFLKKGHFQGGPRLADDQKKLRHFRERADARSLRCRASFGTWFFSPVSGVLGWLTVGFGLGLGPAGGLWHFLGKSRHAVGRFAMIWAMRILIFLLLLDLAAVMFTSFSPTPSLAG